MLVTPFDADGSIQFRDLVRVVEFVLANECAGVSALGLGGEVAALTRDERLEVTRVVTTAAQGGTVIVGCSAGSTEESRELAIVAAEMGAASIMLAPPAHRDWTTAQLLEHYTVVASAVQPVPVMVQDAPSFIGVRLGSSFVSELMRLQPNIRFAKPEALPAGEQAAELVALGITVFGGHGGLYFFDVLEAGGSGMIPGCEIPEIHAELFRAYESGKCRAAHDLFRDVLPLLVTEFQTLDHYIASCKLILAHRGIIERADIRGINPVGELGRKLLLAHVRRLQLPHSGDAVLRDST
jgi:dihydrodipicolinate synthase/N-acetylneuraminate lyase